MRRIISKHSTKPERIFYEVLKEKGIDFKHRWIVAGREVDFIVGLYAIEIDGHEQDTVKNEILVDAGYIPLHLHNSEVTKDRVSKLINKLK